MQVESLIKILSETLKFYSDENNYNKGLIEKDGGHQARHTLKLVKENEEEMKSYENFFEEFENKANELTSEDDLIKMIENLKDLNNGR